jgi:uncharacterized protein YprB with RNaseH-like and TPR domain
MNRRDQLKKQLDRHRENLDRLRIHPLSDNSSLPAGNPPPISSLSSQLDRMRQLDPDRRDLPASVAVPKGSSLPEEFFSSPSETPFVFLENTLAWEQDPVFSHHRLLTLIEFLSAARLECSPDQTIFLDTETTGLSGGTGTYAFLTGIGYWDKGGFKIQQYFMREFREEKALLQELGQRLAGTKLLVTFNGKGFDYPLLESRFILSRLPFPLREAYHLDLLYPARRLWKLRLKDCSLGNLEKKVLKIEREDDVPGNVIPALYFNYLQTRRPYGISSILEHNRQDIDSLAQLAMQVADRLLADHPDEKWFPEELLGAGRYFQKLGRGQLSINFHQAAVQRTMEGGLAWDAMIRLARLYKSRREFEQAIPLWEKLAQNRSRFSLEACECLAIYYEHHAKDLELALSLARKALAELIPPQLERLRQAWLQRLRRLEEKQKRSRGNGS